MATPAPPANPDMDPPDDGEPPAWLGTPVQMGWLLGLVKAVLVLNVIDAVLTVLWVSDQAALEANPFLFELPQTHPLEFVLVKTSLVSGGTYLLWRHRNRATAVIAIFVAFLAYYSLLLLHVSALWDTLTHLAVLISRQSGK